MSRLLRATPADQLTDAADRFADRWQFLSSYNYLDATGNTDADAQFEQIHVFGTRSFSIRDASGNEWSGRGKRPHWLNDALDGGATLIADDLVEMKRVGNRLLLSFPPDSPAELKGKIVARGLSLVDVAVAPPEVELALVVEATPPAEVDILPDSLDFEWLGLPVTTIRIPLLEPSAPAKVRLALAKLTRSIIPPS